MTIGQAGHVGREEPRGSARLQLVELALDHRDHRALVVFVRPIDVEELEPGPARGCSLSAGEAGGDVQVEGVLAPAIEVEGAEEGETLRRIVEALLPGAVGRGGAGVEEGHAPRPAPLPQAPGQVHVGSPDQVAVRGRRLADRAEMDDSGEVRRLVEPGAERVGGEQRLGGMLGEVTPLALGSEPVGDGDALAARDEGGDQVRPDETRAARDHYHGCAL